MIALDELRGYGSFENLSMRIARLPSTGDALTTLFEHVFDRLRERVQSDSGRRGPEPARLCPPRPRGSRARWS